MERYLQQHSVHGHGPVFHPCHAHKSTLHPPLSETLSGICTTLPEGKGVELKFGLNLAETTLSQCYSYRENVLYASASLQKTTEEGGGGWGEEERSDRGGGGGG